MERHRSAGVFVLWLVVVFLVAYIGSRATLAGIGAWYENLRKPSFQPPGWVFGPVWTLLYLLMAVSVRLVWRRRGAVEPAIALFLAQLALNVAWTWIFFTLKSPGAALVEIVVLWLAILATTISFSRVSVLAAWLLAPYLTWVSFAGVLNAAIWRLNR